uniref:Membrane magnesium transporter n=1 Tax=Fagus sylvatica TaxID=28930 RepID=A0A2N9I6K3_FAGSY
MGLGFAVGVFGVLILAHAAYATVQYRGLLKIMEEEFSGPPMNVVAELLLGLVLSMWAALTVPGKFLSIQPNSEENRTTREVKGPYGSGLWKHIRKGWGSFARHLHFEVGDGSKTKFWDDVWCGTCSLQNAFPDLYRIVRHKDAVVGDLLHSQNGVVTWLFDFIRHVQDWELESVNSFLEVLIFEVLPKVMGRIGCVGGEALKMGFR